jgi:SPP1 gp7 family putative phage head morphogenesis protein
MLLDSPDVFKIESRFISLFDRTFKKGISGQSGPSLKTSVKKQFSSKTFEIQIDDILNDLCLYTVDYTDAELNGSTSAAIRLQKRGFNIFASAEVLPLTEEAVRQSAELSELISESIIRTLKNEGIYQEAPATLARRMVDLWGGEKYRAERFARTFSADVANSTALHRYQQNGIEEFQIYARIDDRTSPICRTLHGTIFRADSNEAKQYTPSFHMHCRTTIIPVTLTMKVDPALRYENRDFGKPIGQDFTPLKDGFDNSVITNVFKDVDNFKKKYAIDKFILQEDIEKRLLKLGVNVDVKLPETVTKAKVSKVIPKTAITKTKPGISKLESDIQGYEKGIAKQKTETAYVFDKNGKVLLEKNGGKAQVQFTSDELKRFKNSIVTHNHPGLGGSFSEADIKLACNNGILEMRAAGKQGVHIFKMKDGSAFKPSLYSDKIQKQYVKSVQKVKTEGMIKINKHEITSNKYTQKYWHWVWEDVFSNIPEVDYKLVKLV